MYVLDSNIFVEAYKRYYSFDIAPSFWTQLIQKAEQGLIVSIDRVFQEISNNDPQDELNLWVSNSFSPFFVSTQCQEVFGSYRILIDWSVNQTQFNEAAKHEFASVADSWLIAYAMANNHTIVTHEQYKADVQRRIPIPNACRSMNIPYIDTFQMLRNLNIRLGN